MKYTDKKIAFWDKKIIGWDLARYERNWNQSNPITARLNGALELLKGHIANKTILELGCGTGRTIPKLFELGIKNYVGLDFSERAIREAKLRIKGQPYESNCTFHIQSSLIGVSENPDYIFSLGLLDWLSDDDIRKISLLYKNIPFLHSYSKKEQSVRQLMHKFYVHLLYGWHTKGYVPRYFNNDDLITLFPEQKNRKIKCVKTDGTSFSTFVHNLTHE